MQRCNKKLSTANLLQCNKRLSALSKQGKWREAVRFLDDMESKHNLSTDVVSYSTAIAACARGGQSEKALELLERMQTFRGLEPNAFSYTSAIAAVGSTRVEKGFALLDLMKARNITPTTNTYNVLIAICSRSGDWDRAVQLLRETNSPDVVTYSSCIAACEKAGNAEKALELLREMELSEGTC